MKDYVKYIKVADAVKVLFDDCIRYVFPTTAEPTTEFIKLNDAINKMRQIECKDVEFIVRCRDCKWKADTIGDSWCDFHECTIFSDDNFCSAGERRDDETDRR